MFVLFWITHEEATEKKKKSNNATIQIQFANRNVTHD